MIQFDPTQSRQRAWKIAAKLGLKQNQNLPLLDTTAELQPIHVIVDRLLCLHLVAAYSFGFSLSKTTLWLHSENLASSLTALENEMLSLRSGHPKLLRGRMQVHSLYVLAWCTSIVHTISLDAHLPGDLVTLLPDIKEGEGSAAIRARAQLRPKAEIFGQLDIAYRLHWAWKDALLTSNKRRGRNDLLAVLERRRALEWVFRGGDWDGVALDV